jgi:beta-carotene 3-hydroxylase
MSLLVGIVWRALVALAVAAFMEGVAWFTHKYVMHGLLWVLHEDHHHPKGPGLEKNDLFALFFSIVAFSLMYGGYRGGYSLAFYIGVGVALYGFGYFTFHDVIFHQRLGFRWRPNITYLNRIIHAHSWHHRKSHAYDGVAFGFLYAPRKYAEAAA